MSSAAGSSLPGLKTGFVSRLRVLWWSSAGHRGALLRSTLGVWLGVTLTVLGMSVSASLENGISPLLLGDGARFKVQPARLTIGPLDLMGTLFKPRTLSPERIQALSRLDGVFSVWPELWSRFPVGLRGSLLGHGLYSDGALLGLPPEAVSRELPRPFIWHPPVLPSGGQTGQGVLNPEQPVPVLVPRMLFVVYNGSFAPANGFPRLNERSVVGLTFQIVAGRSSFGASDAPPLLLKAEIVGLTGYADALAAVVPLEAVQWIERQLSLPDAGGFSSALVQVKPGHDPARVQSALQGDGWSVEEVSGAIRQLALALSLVQAAVLGIGGMMIVVALLLMGQVYRLLLERRASELQALWLTGLPQGELRTGLALEGMGLTLNVCLLASLTGLGLSAALLPGLEAYLSHASGLDLSLSPVLPRGLLLALLVLAPLFTWLNARPVLIRLGEPSATQSD